MAQKYQTIHGYPILLAHPIEERADVILVDKGDEYVVASLYKEPDGTPQREWDQGTYFSYHQYVATKQHEALAEALELFTKKASRARL